MYEPRTALVTGGAKRIGAAIVRALAEGGWAVAIHCRHSLREAHALASEIEAKGGCATVVQADLADPEALDGILPAANAGLGPITLLVNNASVFLRDHVGGLDSAVWQTQLDTNLRAPVFLAEAFAAQLPDDTEGSIVNMIDQRVWNPTPAMTSYTLSKAALWMATRTLAQAMAPRIRVNGIGPGPTLPNPYDGDGGFAREVARLPLGHAVDVDDVGRAVRFLVETPSMTGQMLALDSGQHLAWRSAGATGEAS